jgi:hypothetical protein
MTQVFLSPADLGQLLTLITNFMCDKGTSYKTYDEMLAIYNSCKDWWQPHDHANDLRITGYIGDMASGNWRVSSIAIVLGVWEDRVPEHS